MNYELLLQFKRVARFCLGFIWIYLGLVSKILVPVPFEQEIVRKTGLYWSSPALTIELIGIFEIFLGIWLISGIREKLACLITSGFILVLMILAITVEPMLMAGPFGGMVKNVALFVLAWIVWRIASSEHE